MKQKVGIVKKVEGQFKAIDKDGNVRFLKAGDFIYEGDEVSSVHIKDGSLSDAVGIKEMISEDFFVVIQDLRSPEEFLIRQGGYRFFDVEEMGNDETDISRQMISGGQVIGDMFDGHPDQFTRSSFAEREDFLSPSHNLRHRHSSAGQSQPEQTPIIAPPVSSDFSDFTDDSPIEESSAQPQLQPGFEPLPSPEVDPNQIN